MKTFTARQPIFDAMKRVRGYELLFREDEKNRFPAHVSPEMATSKLLLNTFFDTNIEKITEGKLTFINFPMQILKDNFMELLPTKDIIIEILETVEPNEEVFNMVKTMFHKGYRFALDDFEYNDRWDRFFPFISIIKIDIMTTKLSETPMLISKVKEMAKNGKAQKNTKFLAEKVETYDEFKEAKRIGFHLFQGFFFAKPEMIIDSSIPPTQIMLMQLYKECVKEEINFKKVCQYIESDVAIAYKLLRYVNNSKPKTGKRNTEITSIKNSVVFMGETLMRKFIFLIVTAELSVDKPVVLMKTAIQRAKFCETLAQNSALHKYADKAFLIGLFSVIDAILDRSMENIVQDLPLEDEIKKSLVDKIGLYSCFIKIADSYERGEWDVISLVVEQMGISEKKVSELYVASVEWANQQAIVLSQPLPDDFKDKLKVAS
jgi:EAL and modified HD-GYP domain-containing signal transduction protein